MASRNKSLLIHEALSKLQGSCTTIERRGKLKPHEEKRVSEAFALLSTDREEHKSYQWFLSNVRERCGPRQGVAMVVLCAVALGKHAIKILKDDVQVNLPSEIAKKKEILWNEVLDDLGEKYSEASSSVQKTGNPFGHGDLYHPKYLAGISYTGRFYPDYANTSDEDDNAFIPRSSQPDTASHPPSSRHPSVSLDLRVRDLVNFLQEHQEPDKHLQMECPLSGDPLPSICLPLDTSAELMARIEFSQPLATMFIQYVLQRQ